MDQNAELLMEIYKNSELERAVLGRLIRRCEDASFRNLMADHFTVYHTIMQEAHDELNTLYHQAEQMALQLNQKSLELDLLRENITSLQTERQKKEADVSVLQAQVEHLQQNIERARHEMDEQSARSGSIAETMEERQQAIAALDEACAQLDAQVQEKTAQASEVQRSRRFCSARRRKIFCWRTHRTKRRRLRP